MKKILIVEDNREISNNIADYLELENFEITQAFTGETGYDLVKSNKFDLILLDLMLPEIDGNTIARKLASRIDAKIIMITARDSINQKLEGFENGAIDYIVKPFDLRELEARIKANLQINTSSQKLDLGEIQIDFDKREFLREGKKIKITTKEFLIFQYLYENKDRICTRTDLIEYVWGGENLFEDDSKLDVYISNLRKKLDKKLIETVKGIGYKFG